MKREETDMTMPESKSNLALRRVNRVIKGMPATDGAGVELTRVIGQPVLPMLDPFLLLDAFRSDNPEDYIAGFPPHPHRGFETVTYLLAGRLRHEDNAGHEGVIEPGGIQWMTAGKGIVHSEMPEQKNGMLEGFQLWINLPANNKMDEPAYQEYPADDIPLEHREGGVEVRVIAGVTSQETRGPVLQPLTDPLYLDVRVPYEKDYFEELPESHNAFVYVISGSVSLEDEAGSLTTLDRDDLGVLTRGNSFQLHADKEDVRFLLIAGRPLREPVARGGPFVMNTKAEILKAFDDYKNGEI